MSGRSIEHQSQPRDSLPRASRGGSGLRRAGFTLLEILIATAILTIGLVSIVALFPAAIYVGRQVIETSNAVVIGQSVAEAVRDSMRNRKRYTKSGDIYFVLEHDGVKSRIPGDPFQERPTDDYYILLPQHPLGRKFGGGTEFQSRFKSLQSAKTFVYPETDTPANGGGNADNARNDAMAPEDPDRWSWRLRPIRGVYALGGKIAPGGSAGPGSFGELADIKEEILQQYSFALAIIPSFFDGDLLGTDDFAPAGQLYHVKVMVFRNFPQDREVLENIEPPQPVYELDFEVRL